MRSTIKRNHRAFAVKRKFNVLLYWNRPDRRIALYNAYTPITISVTVKLSRDSYTVTPGIHVVATCVCVQKSKETVLHAAPLGGIVFL